jgi:hypothetical protein
MVGYMGKRGYRVYDIDCCGVYEVRNVTFEEGIPHGTCITTDNSTSEDPGLNLGLEQVPVIEDAPTVTDADCSIKDPDIPSVDCNDPLHDGLDLEDPIQSVDDPLPHVTHPPISPVEPVPAIQP